MVKISKGLLVILCVLMICSCANQKNRSPMPSISKDAKQDLAKPVNCSTAKTDVAILKKEKASVSKRMLSGVRSVMPIAAAAGILTGDYNDRVNVATGQYNADLEAKITQIEKACKMKASS